MGQSLGTHLIWVIQYQKALMAYTASNNITQSKLCPRVYTLHSEHHQKNHFHKKQSIAAWEITSIASPKPDTASDYHL